MKQFFKQLLFLLLILNLTVLVAMTDKGAANQIDDWEYNATSTSHDSSRRMGSQGNIKMSTSMPMTMSAPVPMIKRKSIGLSVGGAKDTNNFKANIDNGYLPKLESITYEGQFYNHYFDTGIGSGECKALFCPSYSSAKRLNAYTDEEEYFLSVGLNSGIQEGDFKRKKLNLVVVLDISGSMGSKFNAYHYDKTGSKINHDNVSKNKMTIANESIVAMLSHLNDDDKVGIALFDHNSYRAKALNLVGSSDKMAIREHILALKQRGGTNWSAGYKEGLKLFDEVDLNADYENRIIFLTDAMPNKGELNKNKLFGMAKSASEKGINTTFIGIGVDFNNDLVEYVSKTKGANYFSVHSSKEFSKLLDTEFDYMVTPLVYDLELKLNNSIYSIEAVYGSPESNLATGQIMKINTLFPSHNDGTATKGGVVLLKLKKNIYMAASDKLTLDVSYTDVNGKAYSDSQKVSFKNKSAYYDNNGIRKAVLVSDYVSVMKNWLIDARAGCNDKVSWANQQPIEIQKRCMIYPPLHPEYPRIATWERKSCKLQVSAGYKKFLQLFRKLYVKEMNMLGDESLNKEVDILNILINQKRSTHDDGGAKDDWLYKK
ncbi:MAG TPA: VWA domain-containing protein [Campylobacterales bacterium]|nr:VWA domain-containing protein [Campylobacterales bacterium]